MKGKLFGIFMVIGLYGLLNFTEGNQSKIALLYIIYSMTYIINKKEDKYSEVLDMKDAQIKDMEEYISKWVHEIKLPISAISMTLERIDDEEISADIKNQTEKINFLVNSVMYGSRATAAAEDIFISEIKLQDLIKEAIKNNAFMLIRNNIEIKLDNLD